MELLILMLMSFVLPITAPTWRGLLLRFSIGAAAIAVMIMVLAGEIVGDTSFGSLVALFAGGGLVAGVVARAISLLAAQYGHTRPLSLWIEALAAALVLIVLLPA